MAPYFGSGATTEPRPLIPALAGLYRVAPDIAYLLIRVTAGLMLIPHGWPKLMAGATAVAANTVAKRGIEPALALAYLIIFLETAGGVFIAIGFLTRPIAALLVIEFLVIIFKGHWAGGWFVGTNGIEYVLMWGLLFVAITLRGGGRWSVDHWLGREL